MGYNNWNNHAYSGVSATNGRRVVNVNNNIGGSYSSVISGNDGYLLVNGRRIPYTGGSVSVINGDVWVNRMAV